LSKDERSLSRQVLVAAALTYVAGALSALLQLLRLYLLSQRRRK
ncbi:MAG: zinc metallopeptidase, partial [Treponema sp.]|nr:zinc metallopeptidase [Treponema sp.]